MSWIRSFFWRRFGSLLSYASYCLGCSVIQLNMTSTSNELASSPAPMVVYSLELDYTFRRLLCVCLQIAIPHSNSSLEFHFTSIYFISVCNHRFYQVCAFCMLAVCNIRVISVYEFYFASIYVLSVSFQLFYQLCAFTLLAICNMR